MNVTRTNMGQMIHTVEAGKYYPLVTFKYTYFPFLCIPISRLYPPLTGEFSCDVNLLLRNNLEITYCI